MSKKTLLQVQSAIRLETTDEKYIVWFPNSVSTDAAFARCLEAAYALGLYSRNVSSHETDFGPEGSFAMEIIR